MERHFIACLLACASCAARADLIVLRNGDRISGETLRMSGGELLVNSVYAGEITLQWSEVASIVSDRPLTVLFKGAAAPVRRKLDPGVDLRSIAYLNPKPHESGMGTTYTGRAALSAAYASGNSTSERLYGDAELTARAAGSRTQVSGRIEHRAEQDADATSAWRANANRDRFLDEARFIYLRGSLEHDRAKDLRQRAAAGFGYGAELVASEEANVSLRGGLDYLAQRRYAGDPEDYPALGWGLKATYAPWGPRLELFHEHEGFRNLRASGVVLRSKTGARVPFAPALSATAQVNVDWESRPAPGRKPTDTTLVVGVNYAW